MVDDHEMTCKKLLFTLEKDIVTENCTQWGIDEFVQYRVEAVLADIVARELTLDLTGQGEGKEGGSCGCGSRPGHRIAAEEEPSGISLPPFPGQTSEQAAIRTAGIQGAAKLRFIPYYLIHYPSRGRTGYKDRRIPFDADGWGAINAINGIRLDLDGTNGRGFGDPGKRGGLRRAYHQGRGHRTDGDRADRTAYPESPDQAGEGRCDLLRGKDLEPDRKNITVDTKQVYIPSGKSGARKSSRSMPSPESSFQNRWTRVSRSFKNCTV